jgi:hypothetical protein
MTEPPPIAGHNSPMSAQRQEQRLINPFTTMLSLNHPMKKKYVVLLLIPLNDNSGAGR